MTGNKGPFSRCIIIIKARSRSLLGESLSGHAPTPRLNSRNVEWAHSRGRFFNGMVGDLPWMEVIYSHSASSDCIVDLPLCAGGRRLYGGKVYDLTKKSDTSDMTPTGGDVYLSFFRPRSLESFLKGISGVLSSSYTFKDHLATDPFTRDFNLASDSHRTTVSQWWWNDEQLKESCSLASQEVTHLSKNNSQSDARR